MNITTILSDNLAASITKSIESLGGARAVFGEPIKAGDTQIIPVARIRIQLASAAEGQGGGDIAQSGGTRLLGQKLGGGGGGKAGAGVTIDIEPVGYIENAAGQTRYCTLSD